MWTAVNADVIRKGTNSYRTYRCDCGKIQIVQSHSVRSGKSTGCRKCEGLRRRRPNNYLAWAYLRNSYTTNAKRRGLCWTLSDEQFVEITSLGCFYCGVPPKQMIRRKHAVYKYNGLDRKDNTEGYTTSNVVSCCKICNFAKRDLSYERFMQWIQLLVKRHLPPTM